MNVQFIVPVLCLFLFCSRNAPVTCCVLVDTDAALNGTWIEITESPHKTALKFYYGNFESIFGDTLQQRGIYVTNEGVLTVTITSNYGQHVLDDISNKYLIHEDTLEWGLNYLKE
jgi:hypothetical protein